MFAAAPEDLVVAGYAGIFHYDHGAFVRTSPLIERGLWGTSATNVFAAGDGILRFDGSVWIPEPNTTSTVLAVSGIGTEVYAVGSSSYRFHDALWSAGPFDETLTAVVASPRGIFAAGHTGALRYWRGGAVEPFVSRTNTDLNALFVTGNIVFMAGVDGTLEVMVFHE